MTVAILIRPDRHDSAVRATCRVAGTLLGAGLTTLVLATLRPSPAALSLMLLVAIYACYALQRINYGVFSLCITTYVVLLLSLLNLPEPGVAVRRIEATLVGAAIALAVHLSPRKRRPVTRELQTSVESFSPPAVVS
jgi:uncharacterized membrane protein YccC